MGVGIWRQGGGGKSKELDSEIAKMAWTGQERKKSQECTVMA